MDGVLSLDELWSGLATEQTAAEADMASRWTAEPSEPSSAEALLAMTPPEMYDDSASLHWTPLPLDGAAVEDLSAADAALTEMSAGLGAASWPGVPELALGDVRDADGVDGATMMSGLLDADSAMATPTVARPAAPLEPDAFPAGHPDIDLSLFVSPRELQPAAADTTATATASMRERRAPADRRARRARRGGAAAPPAKPTPTAMTTAERVRERKRKRMEELNAQHDCLRTEHEALLNQVRDLSDTIVRLKSELLDARSLSPRAARIVQAELMRVHESDNAAPTAAQTPIVA